MKLRDYQEKFCNDISRSFDEFDKVLGVMPTGGGKTVCFSYLSKMYARTLIVAHREELISQAAEKIEAITGIAPSIEMGDSRSTGTPTVVSSVQSMVRRLDKFSRNDFDLVVADEAHLSLSDTWAEILNYFNSKILGVTATPNRGDHRALGEFYETCASEVSMVDLINQGYLARIKCVQFPVKIGLDSVRISSGDFVDEDVDSALAPYLHEIAKYMVKYKERKTIVFLPLIRTSMQFSDVCRRHGINAIHVDGQSPDRKDILRDFGEGKYRMLCNSSLLSHGIDIPSIDTVLVLKPTKSQPNYQQMIGRGLRTHPGKDYLLIVDPLWLSSRHKLVKPADLVSSDLINASSLTEFIEDRHEREVDLLDQIVDIKAEREKRLAEEIYLHSQKKEKFLDPIEYAVALLKGTEISTYEPTYRWEMETITPKQAALIQRFGISPSTIKSKGHASKIIGLIMDRRKLGLASPKQVVYLRKMGHPNPMICSMTDASIFLESRFR